MDPSFLDTLCCPSCRGGFAVERVEAEDPAAIDTGVLVCECAEFAVVAGIAVLRRGVGAAIVEAIRRGDPDAAFRHAVYDLVPRDVRTRRRRLIDRALEGGTPLARHAETYERRRRGHAARDALTGSFAEAVDRIHKRGYAEYLKHRFANPSLLGAMAALSVLDAAGGLGGGSASPAGGFRVLDLACGTGHVAHLIERLHRGSTVCADQDYLNLLLLRTYFAPGAPAVCLDLDAPLPFRDDAFDAVVCVDALHLLSRKQLVANEIDRVTRASGGWLVPHVHNAGRPNRAAGSPLPPDEYRRMLGSRDVVILDESYLLDCFSEGLPVDVASPRPPERLEESDALCIIGSGSGNLRRPHEDVLPRLVEGDPRVIVNPIYERRVSSSEVRLRQRWSDDRLRAECADVGRYLPHRTSMDPGLHDRISRGGIEPADRTAVLELMRRFVVVPAPRSYVPEGRQ